MTTVLKSELDSSINYIHKQGDGYFESRFVKRPDSDYFIAYVSSHNGCNQTCKMCHLTQQNETSMLPASLVDYMRQVDKVTQDLDKETWNSVQKIHVNFMARGEPLLNTNVTRYTKSLINTIDNVIHIAKNKPLGIRFPIRFNISTIMPTDFDGNLSEIFADERTTMYYSLYSMKEDFRKKWLPRAMNPYIALDKIRTMQSNTNNKEVVIHSCFIKDHNDSLIDVAEMCKALNDFSINYRFNIVRFNTHDETKYQESDNLDDILAMINLCNPDKPNKIVDRVGYDVNASCGMFI